MSWLGREVCTDRMDVYESNRGIKIIVIGNTVKILSSTKYPRHRYKNNGKRRNVVSKSSVSRNLVVRASPRYTCLAEACPLLCYLLMPSGIQFPA